MATKRDSIWDETVDRPLIGKIERSARKMIYGLASLFVPASRPAPFSWQDIKSVLIIKEPYRMGDLMQITPALAALRKKFPGLYIGLVVQDRNLPIFKNNPDINELFLFEKRKFNKNPWKLFGFMRRIRMKKFDLAVTLETQRTHLTNDLIAYFSGASFRLRYDGAGWDNPESNIFYNLLSPFDPNLTHETEKNFGVFKPLGLELQELSLKLNFSEQDLHSARNIVQTVLKQSGPFVTVHPGAYKINNRWPLKNYLEVGKKLKDQGNKVLFMLGPSEQGWEKEIQDQGFSVAANITILEAAALFSLSRFVLCNDTGIMHIAAAVGAKTLALFGETNPDQWKPPGGHLRVVQSADKKISSIGIEEVLRTVSELV